MSPSLAGHVLVREGFQHMATAAKLFAAADVVTLPYLRASQSGVLLLAYGFERPVVVYPVGGLPDNVFKGDTGWICPGADPAALAETLRNVVQAGAEGGVKRAVTDVASGATDWSTAPGTRSALLRPRGG